MKELAKEREIANFNPFGKPGAGAPSKKFVDQSPAVITDYSSEPVYEESKVAKVNSQVVYMISESDCFKY